MRTRHYFLVLTILLNASAVIAADRPSDAEIRAVVGENLRATQASDLPALLETIHPESLALPHMEASLQELQAYKLKYEAPSVQFVSMTGEYALIRVTQRTTRVGGPAFLDNEIDGIWVLRRDGPAWKYWSQLILTLQPLAQAPKQSPAN